MKKVLLGFIISLTVLNSNAQKNNDSKIAFNVGGELGLASGNLNTLYSLGIGATAQIEYAIDTKTLITVNSGIIEYIGKKVPSTALKNQSNAVIPILGGMKYNLTENLFGAVQIGVSVFTGKVGGNKFTYAPALGFKVNDKVEALVKYTGYSNFGGAFGVRVSYNL